VQSVYGLEPHGIRNANTVWWNLATPALMEHAVQRHEGLLEHLGPLVVRTGQYTGRSPRDKYIVREPSSQAQIAWGEVNQPFDPARYNALRDRLGMYPLERKTTCIKSVSWRVPWSPPMA
jgi:phosphoenolpyruvate carboxykinase (ATP)